MKDMRKRLFIVLALMVCGIAGAWAGEVDVKKAQEIALDFVSKHNNRKSAPTIEEPFQVSGLYVFNLSKDAGYVIVSNDDQTTPILGFSDSGSIDPKNMPDNMRAWLQGYADEIAWFQKNGITAISVADKARRRAGGTQEDEKSAIEPLLTTKWNQNYPYNAFCPALNDNKNCATGCVATAMAQAMYYTEIKAGNSSTTTTKEIPQYTSTRYGSPQGPIPAETTINWSQMIPDYSNSYSSEAATAVACLMWYCGISVEMDYGPESSSNTVNVANALKSYFDYNSTTTKYVSRSYYTYDKWKDMIYYELDHNRPVVYGGQSSGGGHEFVCDGYQYDEENNIDLFHINWGWGGDSDGYFVLASLNPDIQGIGGSSSSDGYHYGQDAVIGIQKSTSNDPIADITPNEVNLEAKSITLSNSTVGVGTQVEITLTITNNSSNEYDGDIYVGKYISSNSFSLLEGDLFTISGHQTENCVINYTPTEEGTYGLVFSWPGANGMYYTYNNVLATLTVVAPVVPTDLNVNYTGGKTAVVSWTSPSSATAFDLDVNGTLIENVTSPYQLTNLEYGSSYSVKVRAKVDNELTPPEHTLHRWTDATTFDTYRVVNYNLSGLNNYSWQGSAILVVDENEEVVENLTISNGTSSVSTLHLTGTYYQFIWQKGAYDSECSWSFTDAFADENNNVLFKRTSGNQSDNGEVLYTIGTIAYSKPKNLVANDVTYTSASIAWTGKDYANSYNLRYRKGLRYDFESATPWVVDDFAPFTTYDGDKCSTYGISGIDFDNKFYRGSVIAFQNGVASGFKAHSGNAFGCFMDVSSDTNSNNDWFITPEVKIFEGDVFTFWARSYTNKNNNLEHFKVGVYGNTDGTFESYLAGGPNTYVEAPTTWTQYSYDLSAYAGQTIKLAINCVSQQVFAFFIDDIFVGNPNAISNTWVSSNTNSSPYELKGLTGETLYEVQVQAVYQDKMSDWSESIFFTTFKDVFLADNATNNRSVVETNDGKTVCVTLTNRTLYKDGAWNTICLPFDVDDGDLTDDVSFSGTPLEGAVVMELDVEEINEYNEYEHQTSITNDGTLYLNFKSANKIEAGTPYIIKWPIDNDNPTIESPVFSNVTISKDMQEVSFTGGKFCGNYNYLQFGSEDTSILLIGINNQGNSVLYYPKPDTTDPENPIYPTLGACRAYFHIGQGEGGKGTSLVRSYVLNFGDDDSATGIIAIGDSQLSTLNSPLSGWYTLDGRKLNSKPTAKGVYVKNGKKIVIK